MDCKELLELLPEYFYGELDRADVTRVTTHLLACESCQQEATELRKVLGVLAKVELPQPSEDFCRYLTEQVITAARSDQITSALPEVKTEPVKTAVPGSKVEPVNTAPLIPAPAPKVIAPKPAPPPAVKPAKVAVPKPVPPVKPKVERPIGAPRRPLITSWKWVTRGVLPAAAAILVLIVARNLLITNQSYESAPDSTKAIVSAPALAPSAPAAEEAKPALTSPTTIQEPAKSPAPGLPGTVLPPPPPPTETKSSNIVIGDVTTMAGIALPPASPMPSKEVVTTKTRSAGGEQYSKAESEVSGYTVSTAKHLESEQKKSVETDRLAEMAYGAAEGEAPAEHSAAVDGKDKEESVELPATISQEYRKAMVTAKVRDEANDDMDKSSLRQASSKEKGKAGAEFLPDITAGKVPPKIADAVYLLDMVGSPSPLVHEETLLLSSDETEATTEDEAVYSTVEPQIPLITDYELLNTLNSMDKTRMEDLKESMVNETGGSK